MGKLADALKKIQENPEDMSTLPQLIANVEEVEDNDQMYQERIQTLQDINRSYLAQIPIPGRDPHEQQEETPEPTLQDATQAIQQAIQGGNE